MGENWVGFQTSPKSGPGTTHTEAAQFVLGITPVQFVALLTTADGLQQWLATPTKFELRRGGSMRFADGEDTFGGSYTVVDVPKRVIVVTERHGEIDVQFNPRTSRVELTLRRFVRADEDAAAVVDQLRSTVSALQEVCHGNA